MDSKSVLRLLLLCFSVLGVACGQQPLSPADSQFTQDFGTDSIHLQSLSIEVKAPVLAKPGAIPFGYALYGANSCQGATLNGSPNVVCGFLNQYNASLNCESSQCLSLPAANTLGTWTKSYTSSTNLTCSDGFHYTKYTGLSIISPDGQTYALPSSSYLQVETGGTLCDHPLADFTLTGGVQVFTGSFGAISQVVFPNGIVYSLNSVSDPFGNTITQSSGTYTDTLGNNTFSVASQAGSTGEIDTYKDTGGTSQQVSQILTPETVKTTFGCATWPDQTLTGKYAVTEIDYPDGNNIGLSYETVTGGITGRIASVTLRTGGTVNYSYGSMNCPSMIPASLTRTDATGARTYTFALSGTHGTTTTVLDPGKNKTVYTFQGTDSTGLPVQGTPLTLSEVQAWQNTGTVAIPAYTLLSTTIYCYNGNATNCPTTQAAYPITQKDVYVAPGSKTTYSRTKYLYDTGCGGSCGNVTSVARYDFTTIGGGTADNTTTITYGNWNGSACVAVGSSIINKPCDVKTTDSAAHVLAESRHTYSSKGFETQAQNWTGSRWITASATPNTNGTVASSTSPLGQVTTYSYAATGSGGCNAILPTGTSTTVGGVALTSGKTWDCNGGKLMTATDANGDQSTFTYDLLFRPSSQTDPTTYAVSESYPTNTTATTSDPFISTTTKVDGLGRTIRTQTTDGASYDTLSIAYGFTTGTNPQFQVSTSQPCIAGLNIDCTLVHASITDPIGRNIQLSTTSRENLATAYNQNDIASTLTPIPTGEHSKVVQTEYDGLGRVKSTCAIQATGGTACGQVDGNSGIVNNYTYSYNADGSSNVVNVRGGQNHTDVYDSLGRDVSVFRPEHGTITYTFDTISTADACHGSGFNSYGTLLRKTNNDGSYECYVYDSIGRVTAVGNSSNSTTPCRRFRYDSTSNGLNPAPSGYVGNNLKGRLMEASTDSCTGTLLTDEWFSYDDDGRIADVWESTVHSGGFYHTTAAYYLNGQPHTLSGVPGKSTYTVTLDTEGRPDSSTLGATALVTNVNYNGANQVTSFAYGSSGGNDAFLFDSNTGKMTKYTYTVGAATDVGTLTWNTNGTLKTLAIVDGLNAGGTQTCNFTYDDLARLLTDNCGAVWNQSYTYDQFHNLKKSGTTIWNPVYNSANNFITGAGYDGAGKVTYDLNNSYAWDVYGKMITANAGASVGSCGAAGVTCLTYDAFGRPAEKNVAGTFTEFLYSPLGLTATMSGMTTTFFRLPLPGGASLNGNSANPNTINHYDWLGSARLVTNLSTSVLLDTAYTPYGEKYATFGSNPQNFTGDYQDIYAGLFDTPNREFDVSAGSRWLSPDPARASWNAFSYPTNPNSFIDPLGLDPCPRDQRRCVSHVSTGSEGGGGYFDLGGVSSVDPFGIYGLPVVDGTGFSGGSNEGFSATLLFGGQTIPVTLSGGTFNVMTGDFLGSGLNPFMTVNPQHPTGAGKKVHPKKKGLKRIIPQWMLVGLAYPFRDGAFDSWEDGFITDSKAGLDEWSVTVREDGRMLFKGPNGEWDFLFVDVPPQSGPSLMFMLFPPPSTLRQEVDTTPEHEF